MTSGRNRGDREIDRRRFLQATGGSAAALAIAPGTVAGFGSDAYSTTDYTLESFDGTEIQATLFTPDAEGPNPAILMTHGWGFNRSSPLVQVKAAKYATAGYVVLTYTSRGWGDSGGMVELNGPKEVKDGQRLLDWLAERDAVETVGPGNPVVGMDGNSYGGGIQLLLAAADDRVDAIVPRWAWWDLQYSLAPNGVIKYTWLAALLGLGTISTGFGNPGGSTLMPELSAWAGEAFRTNDLPQEAVEAGQVRSPSSKSGLETPTLIVHGWQDTLFKPTEAVRMYEALQSRGVETRLAFYDGGHAIEELLTPLDQRKYLNDLALTWFDRHLRGENVDVPQSTLYLSQPGEFRADDQFPPAGVTDDDRDAMTVYEFADADRDGRSTIERASFYYDQEVQYNWTIDEAVEMVGTPTVEVTVDVDRREARLFFNLQHDGDGIKNVGEAYRFDGEGRHSAQFEYPAFQRFFDAGDEFGMQISTESFLYLGARWADGVEIIEEESRLYVPQRPR